MAEDTNLEVFTLDRNFLTGLKSFQDHVDAYIRLKEWDVSSSWMKADILASLSQHIGGQSLQEFSKEVGEPRSTITNYIRVAKAFPQDQRYIAVPFTIYYISSFADVYDEKTEKFLSETRFDWVARANDEQLSSRHLANAIQKEKKTGLLPQPTILCGFCGQTDSQVESYMVYGPNREVHNWFLHPDCFLEISAYAEKTS